MRALVVPALLCVAGSDLGAQSRLPRSAYATAEALDRRTDAVAEYCRYLTLAPDAADAAEVRARIAALTDPGGFAVPAAAAQAFATALAHYDAGRLIEAETALGSALTAAPDWADTSWFAIPAARCPTIVAGFPVSP